VLKWLWRRRRIDEDTRAELEWHRELLVDRYLRSGLTPDEAHRAAARQLGNVTRHLEDIHSMNGFRWMDGLIQDLHYAWRQLRHSPGFCLVVIATLGLGIGGTTAVFTVMHGVVLEPLPYPEPERLVRLFQQRADDPAIRTASVSASHFHLARNATGLTHVAGARSPDSGVSVDAVGLDLFTDGRAQRLRVLFVTADYFDSLSLAPLRGPGFEPVRTAGTHQVVLSDALWRTRFDSNPSVIGTTIRLSGEPYEVAGVAPEGLEDPIVGGVDLWLPHDLDARQDTALSSVVGRVRAGVRLEQLNGELEALSQSMTIIEEDRQDGVQASRVVAVPLHDDVVGPSRPLLRLVAIGVAVMLLVACANVANLMLVRASARVHEFALRAALGSGRRRLARQVMVETMLLAALGGGFGVAIAALGVRGLRLIGQSAVPRLETIELDAAMLAFATALTAGTALLCGMVPALRVANADPHRALLRQPRAVGGSRRQSSIRNGLVAAQLALALALLSGAGVLSVSFYRLMSVPLGFRADRILTFEVHLPEARYGDAARRARFHEELSDRLAALPGVTAAGATSQLPTTGSLHPWGVRIETGPSAGTRVVEADFRQHRTIAGGFFQAMAIPLLAGRAFDERDGRDAPTRAVVSENFARRAFPGLPLEQVVGQRIRVVVGGTREIIGVVGDVAVDVYGKPTAAIYSSHRQLAHNRNWALRQVVSAEGPPERSLSAVRDVVARLDPELVVHRPAVMADVVGRGTSRERFAVVLTASFAGMALGLALVGLYGVLAYTVRQRTAEIGIRIALGATAWNVGLTVFRQAAVLLAIGVIGGTTGAFVLGRGLSSFVFQVSPWDLRILGGTALLFLAIALVAVSIPARRAARIDPVVAIYEH
jgi:predicted permease